MKLALLCCRAARLRAAPALIAILVAGTSLVCAGPLHAEPAQATASAPSAAIGLVIRGDTLPATDLVSALARELGRPVRLLGDEEPQTAGVLTVTYRRAAGELAVTWDSPERGTISRVIAAPERVEDVIRDSTLLAGNLTRSQLDDLGMPAAAPQAAVTAPMVGSPSPLQNQRTGEDRIPVSASFFYPLATHYGQRSASSHLDFNLLYGRIGGIDGVQLGLVNVVAREDQAAAAVRGLQLGGFANLVEGDVQGIQIAGLFNGNAGAGRGLQLALLGNSSSGAVQGVQAALGFNRAARGLEGLQLALLNIGGDVDGAQVGLVNIARRVRGTSVGLVNVADDVDGVPLAPISVTRSGGVHPVLWSGTSGLGNVGVKFATRHTYSVFFGAYHRTLDHEFWGGGVALGGRIPLGQGFNVDVDALGTYLIAPDSSQDVRGAEYHEQLVQPRLRALLNFRAARHAGAFVGGAALLQIRGREDWDRITIAVGPELFGGVEL